MHILTEREFNIVCFVAEGCTNRQIAESLNMAEDDVRACLLNIYREAEDRTILAKPVPWYITLADQCFRRLPHRLFAW